MNNPEQGIVVRSTTDLIAELEEEAPKHLLVVIAVMFDKRKEQRRRATWNGRRALVGSSASEWMFLEATDPEPQHRLDEAVDAGGSPLGLIAIDRDTTSKELLYQTRVFAGVTPEERADRILRQVAVKVGELIPSPASRMQGEPQRRNAGM